MFYVLCYITEGFLLLAAGLKNGNGPVSYHKIMEDYSRHKQKKVIWSSDISKKF